MGKQEQLNKGEQAKQPRFAGREARAEKVPTLNLFQGNQEWPITELVHHEYIQQRCADSHGSIQTHRHLDLFHVMYLYHGSARASLDGEEFRINAPLLVTVPAMCVHGFNPTETVHGHLLTIPGSSLSHLLSYEDTYSLFSEHPTIISGNNQDRWGDLDQLFKDLAREYNHDHPSRFLAIQSLLRLIFVWSIRHRPTEQQALEAPANDRDSQRIRRFKKLIEQHYRSGMSIKEYASLMGLSSAQLNNICRAKVGQSALHIVHERVTLEAKRLLIYTAMSISEIAYELGFSDPAYFTRFFSKQVGTAPKQYRAKHRPEHGIREMHKSPTARSQSSMR